MAQIIKNEANELCHIYSFLVKLRSNLTSLFPRKFFIKLLDDKLNALDDLAKKLVNQLFVRLINPPKEAQERNPAPNPDPEYHNVSGRTFEANCSELDEYFHHCVFHLHDFVKEFGWYEPDIDSNPSGKDKKFMEERCKLVLDFFAFRKLFSERTQEQSTNKLESPSRRKLVKFKDSVEENSQQVIDKRQRNLHYSQTILAADLLMYSMSLFVGHLSLELEESTKRLSSYISSFLDKLIESKRKIRSIEMESVCREIRICNHVYLTVLEHLKELRKVYVTKFMLGTLCSKDSRKLLESYKQPRADLFIERLIVEREKIIITKLAENSLQLLNDLITCELNIPPIELEVGTKDKTREGMVRSRENYFNFITSWLNVDDIVFGYLKPTRESAGGKLLEAPISRKNTSTLVQFKSSSRILGQMDNLSELMAYLLGEISARLEPERQLKFLLEHYELSLELSFESFSRQLMGQLKICRLSQSKDSDDFTSNLDAISAKIRCLKLTHITLSMDKLIKETATKNNIDLADNSHLSEMLNKFSQNSGNL